MSSFFKKVSQGAQKLFKNATGNNGIFKKTTDALRKGDNTIQRVGNFLLPLADKIGMGGALQSGLGEINNARQYISDEVNNVKNGLERAVKAPMGSIQQQNRYS